MQAMTIYFTPHSSFRGSRPPRSDTLFGALCWGYRLLYGKDKLVDMLQHFARNEDLSNQPKVPFLLSSCFVYTIKDGKKTHYLPKPFGPPLDTDRIQDLNVQALKKLRKKRWITTDDFTALISGQKKEFDFYLDIVADMAKPPEKEITELFQKEIAVQMPHNTLNRLTGTVEGPEFFYGEEYFPLKGVYCCVKVQSQYQTEIQAVFHFLADKGIGGDVSIGKGHGKIDTINTSLPFQDKEPNESESTHVVTLSLTHPDASLKTYLKQCWYELETRQGRIDSMFIKPEHVWKDYAIMLKEGSVFPKNGQMYYGQNPKVRKNDDNLGFDVQQYGYAFTVNTCHIPT